MRDLSGHVVAITGASAGIGAMGADSSSEASGPPASGTGRPPATA